MSGCGGLLGAAYGNPSAVLQGWLIIVNGMVYSDFVARVLLVRDPLLPWTLDQQITVGIESHGHLASFVLGVIWECPHHPSQVSPYVE